MIVRVRLCSTNNNNNVHCAKSIQIYFLKSSKSDQRTFCLATFVEMHCACIILEA